MVQHDAERCIGCLACVVACRQVHEHQEDIYPLRIERVFKSEPKPAFQFQMRVCHHCEEPACVTVCPNEALYQEGGYVLLARDRCLGCSLCVSECPYGAIQMAGDIPVKCHGCLQRQYQGLMPACVRSCPTGALRLANA